MSISLRYPFPSSVKNLPAEADQIITLLNAVAQFEQGGPANYASVAAWKTLTAATASPHTCVAIEFTADKATIIGDGTKPIGLYGELDGIGKTLLGILGISLGNTYPQIPIEAAGIGYTKLVDHVALYDRLSIGGIGGVIPFTAGAVVTVVARPVIQRVWVG